MKNYAEMSSNDLNFEVAKYSFDAGWLDRHYGKEGMVPDYCSNWSDAGPVIEENHIWLQPDMIGDGLWHCYDREDEFHSKHKNPLRAAMIVFLMMKDADE